MIIQSRRVFFEDEFKPCQIEIVGEKIVCINEYNAKKVDKDYGEMMILPGFYDVHCHGYYGYDTNDAEEEGLRYWLKNITAEGVCGICPTTITQSIEILKHAFENVANVAFSTYEGARILGCHLEGPFISKEFKGAQPEEYIIKPNITIFNELQKAAKGLIKICTIAVEEDENYQFTKYLKENNVNVSLGHSAASCMQAYEAIENGANCFTHTFNGMSRFSHREPKLVGAALSSDVFAECICDEHHSDIAALRIFFKCKGRNGLLVTDGLKTKGLPIGTRTLFGGQETIVIEDGTCRLVSTGNFAGSTLKVNEGLRNLVKDVKVPFEVALASITSAPARYLKIDDHKGYLKVDYDADIAVLDDAFNVKATYVQGELFDYE